MRKYKKLLAVIAIIAMISNYISIIGEVGSIVYGSEDGALDSLILDMAETQKKSEDEVVKVPEKEKSEKTVGNEYLTMTSTLKDSERYKGILLANTFLDAKHQKTFDFTNVIKVDVEKYEDIDAIIVDESEFMELSSSSLLSPEESKISFSNYINYNYLSISEAEFKALFDNNGYILIVNDKNEEVARIDSSVDAKDGVYNLHFVKGISNLKFKLKGLRANGSLSIELGKSIAKDIPFTRDEIDSFQNIVISEKIALQKKLKEEKVEEVVSEEKSEELKSDENILLEMEPKTEESNTNQLEKTEKYYNFIETINAEKREMNSKAELVLDTDKTSDKLILTPEKNIDDAIKVEPEDASSEDIVETEVQSKVEDETIDMSIPEDRIERLELENSIRLNSTETKVDLFMSSNSLSTTEDNDIKFDVKLRSNSEKYELFKDPVIEIIFPTEIEKIDIDNMNLLYKNGIDIEYWQLNKTEAGENVLKIVLGGTQENYGTELIDGITVSFDAKINVSSMIASKTSTIKYRYTNAYAKHIIYQEKLLDADTKDIEIVGENRLLKKLEIVDINTGEKLMDSFNLDRDIKTIEPKENLNLRIKETIINNYENDITDVVIEGKLADDNDEKSMYNATIKNDSVLGNKILGNGLKVYEETAETLDEYKLVLDNGGVMHHGDKVEFEYDVEVMSPLEYNQILAYKNTIVYTLNGEKSTDTTIFGFETEKKEVTMEDLLTYSVLKKNENTTDNEIIVENIEESIDADELLAKKIETEDALEPIIDDNLSNIESDTMNVPNPSVNNLEDNKNQPAKIETEGLSDVLKIGSQVLIGDTEIEGDEVKERQLVKVRTVIKNVSNKPLNNIKLEGKAHNGNIYYLNKYKIFSDSDGEEVTTGEFIEDKDGNHTAEMKMVDSLAPGEEVVFDYQYITLGIEKMSTLEKVSYAVVSVEADEIIKQEIESKKYNVIDSNLEIALSKGDLENQDNLIIPAGDEYNYYSAYVKNISSNDMENVSVQFVLPSNLHLNHFTEIDNPLAIREINNIDGGIVEMIIPEMKSGEEKTICIATMVDELPLWVSEIDTTVGLKVEVGDELYIGNNLTRVISQTNTSYEAKLVSDKEGKTLSNGEIIKYTFTIKNVGVIVGTECLSTRLPDSIIPISAKMIKEDKSEYDIEISQMDDVLEEYTNNKFIDYIYDINPNETITFEVMAMYDMSRADTEDNNIDVSMVSGDMTETLENSVIVEPMAEEEVVDDTDIEEDDEIDDGFEDTIIDDLDDSYVEVIDTTEEIDDVVDYEENDSIEYEVETENNEEKYIEIATDEGSNIKDFTMGEITDKDIPVKTDIISKEDSCIIKGMVWVDADDDGYWSQGEETIRCNEVKLYNIDKNAIVASTLTNDLGIYTFYNVDAGKYIVMYSYDSNAYQFTKYYSKFEEDHIVSNVNQSKILDDSNYAISDTINIKDGAELTVNLGLKEIDRLDLKVNSFVKKVKIQKGDKEDIYEFEKDDPMELELKKRSLKNSDVTIDYVIELNNIGNVNGFVGQLSVGIPEGFDFDEKANPNWYKDNDRIVYNGNKLVIQNNNSDTITVSLSGKVKNSKSEMKLDSMINNIYSYGNVNDLNDNNNSSNMSFTLRYNSQLMYNIIFCILLTIGFIVLLLIMQKYGKTKIIKYLTVIYVLAITASMLTNKDIAVSTSIKDYKDLGKGNLINWAAGYNIVGGRTFNMPNETHYNIDKYMYNFYGIGDRKKLLDKNIQFYIGTGNASNGTERDRAEFDTRGVLCLHNSTISKPGRKDRGYRAVAVVDIGYDNGDTANINNLYGSANNKMISNISSEKSARKVSHTQELAQLLGWYAYQSDTDTSQSQERPHDDLGNVMHDPLQAGGFYVYNLALRYMMNYYAEHSTYLRQLNGCIPISVTFAGAGTLPDEEDWYNTSYSSNNNARTHLEKMGHGFSYFEAQDQFQAFYKKNSKRYYDKDSVTNFSINTVKLQNKGSQYIDKNSYGFVGPIKVKIPYGSNGGVINNNVSIWYSTDSGKNYKRYNSGKVYSKPKTSSKNSAKAYSGVSLAGDDTSDSEQLKKLNMKKFYIKIDKNADESKVRVKIKNQYNYYQARLFYAFETLNSHSSNQNKGVIRGRRKQNKSEIVLKPKVPEKPTISVTKSVAAIYDSNNVKQNTTEYLEQGDYVTYKIDTKISKTEKNNVYDLVYTDIFKNPDGSVINNSGMKYISASKGGKATGTLKVSSDGRKFSYTGHKTNNIVLTFYLKYQCNLENYTDSNRIINNRVQINEFHTEVSKTENACLKDKYYNKSASRLYSDASVKMKMYSVYINKSIISVTHKVNGVEQKEEYTRGDVLDYYIETEKHNDPVKVEIGDKIQYSVEIENTGEDNSFQYGNVKIGNIDNLFDNKYFTSGFNSAKAHPNNLYDSPTVVIEEQIITPGATDDTDYDSPTIEEENHNETNVDDEEEDQEADDDEDVEDLDEEDDDEEDDDDPEGGSGGEGGTEGSEGEGGTEGSEGEGGTEGSEGEEGTEGSEGETEDEEEDTINEDELNDDINEDDGTISTDPVETDDNITVDNNSGETEESDSGNEYDPDEENDGTNPYDNGADSIDDEYQDEDYTDYYNELLNANINNTSHAYSVNRTIAPGDKLKLTFTYYATIDQVIPDKKIPNISQIVKVTQRNNITIYESGKNLCNKASRFESRDWIKFKKYKVSINKSIVSILSANRSESVDYNRVNLNDEQRHDNKIYADCGDIVRYKITIKNEGDKDNYGSIYATSLLDMFYNTSNGSNKFTNPSGSTEEILKLINTNISPWTTNNLNYTYGNEIKPGNSVDLYIEFNVKLLSKLNEQICNHAFIKSFKNLNGKEIRKPPTSTTANDGFDVSDSWKENNVGSKDYFITKIYKLTVKKEIIMIDGKAYDSTNQNEATCEVGDEVKYRITVTNSGESPYYGRISSFKIKDYYKSDLMEFHRIEPEVGTWVQDSGNSNGNYTMTNTSGIDTGESCSFILVTGVIDRNRNEYDIYNTAEIKPDHFVKNRNGINVRSVVLGKLKDTVSMTYLPYHIEFRKYIIPDPSNPKPSDSVYSEKNKEVINDKKSGKLENPGYFGRYDLTNWGKFNNPVEYDRGDKGTYVIRVKDTGKTCIYGVQLDDVLESGLTFYEGVSKVEHIRKTATGMPLTSELTLGEDIVTSINQSNRIVVKTKNNGPSNRVKIEPGDELLVYINFRVDKSNLYLWNLQNEVNVSDIVNKHDIQLRTPTDILNFDVNENKEYVRMKDLKVKGTIWVDANKDGMMDNGETKVKGVQATLIDNTNMKRTTVLSDNSGTYRFVKTNGNLISNNENSNVLMVGDDNRVVKATNKDPITGNYYWPGKYDEYKTSSQKDKGDALKSEYINYYIEFGYNGGRYAATNNYAGDSNLEKTATAGKDDAYRLKVVNGTEPYHKDSNATEFHDMREAFQAKLETINYNSAAGSSGEYTQLVYDKDKHISTIVDDLSVNPGLKMTAYSFVTDNSGTINTSGTGDNIDYLWLNRNNGKVDNNCYSGESDYLKEINLGLKVLEFDMVLEKDLYNVRTTVNGEEVVYDYFRGNNGAKEPEYVGKYATGGKEVGDVFEFNNYKFKFYTSDYEYRASKYENQEVKDYKEGTELDTELTYVITLTNSYDGLTDDRRHLYAVVNEITEYYPEEFVKYNSTTNKSKSEKLFSKGSNNLADYLNRTDGLSYTEAYYFDEAGNRHELTLSNDSSYKIKDSTGTEIKNDPSRANQDKAFAGYNKLYITGLQDIVLDRDEKQNIYIKYTLDKDASDNNNLKISNGNTVSEINSYSTYEQRTDTKDGNGKIIKSKGSNPAGYIDVNSNPGNLGYKLDGLGNIIFENLFNYKEYENDSYKTGVDMEKGSDGSVENTQRRLTGFVWDDARSDTSGSEGDKQYRGNGEYKETDKKNDNARKNAVYKNKTKENSDEPVESVRVKLIELVTIKDASGKEKIYEETMTPSATSQMVTTTDSTGKFELRGFIPGQYIVRYEYGYETEVNKQRKNMVLFNGQDYKSTLYNDKLDENEIIDTTNVNSKAGDKVLEALTGKNRAIGTTAETYPGTKSDARDDPMRRLEVNAYSEYVSNEKSNALQISKNKTESLSIDNKDVKQYEDILLKNTSMYADTPTFPVRIEDDNYTSSTTEYSYDHTNNIMYVSENKRYLLENIDFGLEYRPEADVDIDEYITEIKVITPSKDVIYDLKYDVEYDGNKYVSRIRKTNVNKATSIGLANAQALYRNLDLDVRGFIYLNVDADTMHGTTVEITYVINVNNISEVDRIGSELRKILYEANATGLEINREATGYENTLQYRFTYTARNELAKVFSYNWTEEGSRKVRTRKVRTGKDYYGKYLGSTYYTGDLQNNRYVSEKDEISMVKINGVLDYVDNDMVFDTSINEKENAYWRAVTSKELSNRGLINKKIFSTLTKNANGEEVIDNKPNNTIDWIVSKLTLTDNKARRYDSDMSGSRLALVVDDSGTTGQSANTLNKSITTFLLPEVSNIDRSSAFINLFTTKLISSSEDTRDMSYDNVSEIVEYRTETGRVSTLASKSALSNGANRSKNITVGNANLSKLSDENVGDSISRTNEPDTTMTETVKLAPPTGRYKMGYYLKTHKDLLRIVETTIVLMVCVPVLTIIIKKAKKSKKVYR